MQPEEMPQEMIAFQRRMIEDWDAATGLISRQAQASAKLLLDATIWLPHEGRQAVDQWMTMAETERGRFKAHLDQGMAVVEKLFSAPETPSTAAPKPAPNSKKKKKERSDEPE